jgi:hypothetical protein
MLMDIENTRFSKNIMITYQNIYSNNKIFLQLKEKKLMRRFYPFLFPLFCLVFLVGCKLTIATFNAPDTANTGSVITLTISCIASNVSDGSTMNGIVVQIPDGWSVLNGRASTGANSGNLIEDAGIAGLYTVETGNVIWAGTISPPGSITEGSTVSFTVKVLTGNFSGSTGQTQVFNLKAVTGGKRSGVWETDDPENVFDFASVSSDKYNKSITVTKVDDIIAPNPVFPIVASLYSSSNAVKLSWSGYNEDAQGDVVKYRVYRSETDFADISSMTPIGEVTTGSFSFIDDNVIPGNGYHYAVTAVDELGHENPAVSAVYIYISFPGSIGGTLHEADSSTRIIGKDIVIIASSEDCNNPAYVASAYVNSSTGDYTITGLLPGAYHLKTQSSDNYFSEWWASPLSVRDCSGAQSIVVAEGQAVINKNFQLDPGATISGTVYQSDGLTPLTGKSIQVNAYTGLPCSSFTIAGYAFSNSTNGTYTINALPAGTYYLLTSSSDNYFNEWWASPLSVRDCAGAQSIVVTEGQAVIVKNFQLDPGATISGTIYQSDGLTPLTGKNIYVNVYTGSPCGNPTYVGYDYVDSTNGTYTINGLPAGTYYLKTSSSENYFAEWWAPGLSVQDCAGAQPIVVAEEQAVTNKNFQLEPGATISGTIYESDGRTPLTGKSFPVYAYTGSPCGSLTSVGSAIVDSTNGTYTINALPAGTYYLKTNKGFFIFFFDHIIEWWASPLSVRDCAGAQSIVVTEGQAVTGKNFQLEQSSLNLTISGSIKTGTAAPIPGVTVTFSNSGGTATTDAGGNYSLTVASGYSGTATPSKAGYIFTPANRTYSNVIATTTGQNYTGDVSKTISGIIRTGTAAPIPGVTVTFSNSGGTATTDASGNYSQKVVHGYSGTATPSKAGFLFTPATRTYSNVITNQIAQNYTGAISPIISGSIKTGTGTAISGVKVTFSNGGGTATTDTSGNYSQTVVRGYSGTGTPSKVGFIFTPTTKTYSNVTANQAAQNYKGVASTRNISGSIKTGTGTAISGVKVTFSNGGGTVTTDASGNYSKAVGNWYSGTATPSKAGYIFTPATRTYSNVTVNKTAQNYTGAISPIISGSIKTGTGTAISGVKVTFSNGGGTATTDASGNYSQTVVRGYSGTATPSKVGYSFTPATKTYSNVITNKTAQNYKGVATGASLQLWGAWSDGVWTWKKASGEWTKIPSTEDALMIASGNVYTETYNDLIGVWSSGLWVYNSSNGQWVHLTEKLPTWIAAGDINDDGLGDIIGTWEGDGTYYRDSATGKWIKIAPSAKQLTVGKFNGSRDDLIGVWDNGLWLRNSLTSEWQKIDGAIPSWITRGNISDSNIDEIIASYNSGTWILNSAVETSIRITDPVEQMAMGDIDGDGKDDMIAVLSSGLHVVFSSSGEWQLIKSSKPTWITTGLIEDSILPENSKQDPKKSKEGILDLTNEGPGGVGFNAEVLNESGPELME